MEVKVYINKDQTATFTCPECNRSRIANVAQYITAKTAVKVNCTCKCGHTYTVSLERRKNFRKNTNLPGKYTTVNNKQGIMTVTDVSHAGMGFKLDLPHDFSTGDKLMAKFNLDDPAKSLIQREVVIRSVRDLKIGAEFCKVDQYDRLGAYLM